VRLGIDPGSARIGVARCDPDGLLGYPAATVPRGRGDLDRLVGLALEHDAVEVIVGLPDQPVRPLRAPPPRRPGSSRMPWPAAWLPIPVRLVDERFTTVLAHDALRRGGKDARARRQVVDQAAAALHAAGRPGRRADGRTASRRDRHP